jgi:stage IV sporulation protein FB
MRDLLGWKLSFGRYAGVQVSLHLFFLLFAGFWLYQASRFQDGLVWYGALGLGLLMLSVLAHEAGHALAARAVGGEFPEMLLVPWGGLAGPELARWDRDDHTASQQDLLIALAGPGVNFLVAIITAPILIAWQVPVTELMNPLVPPVPTTAGVFAVSLLFWLNFILTVFNLLPAFPMDGGRILRAVLWKFLGFRQAVLWAALVGQSVAVLLFIAAIVLGEGASFAKISCVLLAVFVFVSARAEVYRLQEASEEDAFLGYDFSQGYTSLERDVKAPPEPRLGPVQQWLENRRLAKLERQRQIEVSEELRLDDILARLHEVGREGLSEEDRRILDRVSARYRNRLGMGRE